MRLLKKEIKNVKKKKKKINVWYKSFEVPNLTKSLPCNMFQSAAHYKTVDTSIFLIFFRKF